MIIANPIYDVVFKRLMEDERIAKFLTPAMMDEMAREAQKAETEQEAWRSVEAMFDERTGKLKAKLSEAESELTETKSELTDTKSALTDAQKEIEELKRRLNER